MIIFLRLLACLSLASIAACTTHRRRQQSEPQQVPLKPFLNERATIIPQAAQYFTVGSTMQEVAALMGTPDQIENYSFGIVWHYGYSKVTFQRGYVTEWNNRDRNLKIGWGRPNSANELEISSANTLRIQKYIPHEVALTKTTSVFVQSQNSDAAALRELEAGNIVKVISVDGSNLNVYSILGKHVIQIDSTDFLERVIAESKKL